MMILSQTPEQRVAAIAELFVLERKETDDDGEDGA